MLQGTVEISKNKFPSSFIHWSGAKHGPCEKLQQQSNDILSLFHTSMQRLVKKSTSKVTWGILAKGLKSASTDIWPVITIRNHAFLWILLDHFFFLYFSQAQCIYHVYVYLLFLLFLVSLLYVELGLSSPPRIAMLAVG